MIVEWSFPTRVLFGEGALARVGDPLSQAGVGRPLVVVDPGIVASGLCQRLQDTLAAGGLSACVFDGVDPNPIEKNVIDGVSAYRDGGCDGVIAMGGGSPMDAAKIIRLGVTHARPLADYDDAKNGSTHIGPAMPPMLAIPTTAGTGSEVGRSGVVMLEATKRKTVIFSPHLLPGCAVLDPELTWGLPARTTAATGIDALTHGIEAYLAVGDHPMADGIALETIERVARFLERAVQDGSDREARREMMVAAMMGAVAFQKGLGACHSLAHPLSSEAGLHHGLANALMLPAVLRFNASAAGPRLERVAAAMNLPPGSDAGERVARGVESLRSRCGLPATLTEVGVDAALVPRLAAAAFEDACHQGNPRPVSTDDLAALYRAAL